MTRQRKDIGIHVTDVVLTLISLSGFNTESLIFINWNTVATTMSALLTSKS